MCKHAVKQLLFVIRYVPDLYKTQKVCGKTMLENDGTLVSAPDCYKKILKKKNYNKAVYNYAHAFVPNFYKTQEICNKAANTSLSAIQFVPECYYTQEMCNKVVDTCPFEFNSIPDWYKTQKNVW